MATRDILAGCIAGFILSVVVFVAITHTYRYIRDVHRSRIRDYMESQGFSRYYNLDQFTFDHIFFWVKTVNGVEFKFYETTLFKKSLSDVKAYVDGATTKVAPKKV